MNAYNLTDNRKSVSPDIIAPFLSEEHSAELRNSGLDEANILASRIFTTTNKNEGKKLTGYPLTGLVIPYTDPTGKPYTTSKGKPYYRIKPDWGNDPDKDEKPKYLSPKGEGNRPYFAPTYTQWAKALRFKKIPFHITEGEKKAALLGALGYAAIGLTGVHGWKDKTIRTEELTEIPAQLLEDLETREQELNNLEESRALPELEFINDANIWEYRKVYITFDSDIVHKWQVRAALEDLADWLESKGAEPYIVLLPTELDGDKNGADDLVFRHGKEAYEALLHWAEPALKVVKKQKVLTLQSEPTFVQKADLLWSVLKDHWRYRPGIGWHRWTGTHWQLTDDGGGTFIDDDIYRFMNHNRWKQQGKGVMSDLMRKLRAMLHVTNWNPKHKIAFQNGVLNIESGQFTPGLNREDFITVVLPYNFDPDAKCPTWETFINTALKNDRKAIELVQAFFKWSLLPKPAGKLDVEICWDLYGQPGTGKGTTLETLRKIVGLHNCGSFSTRTFKNDNALAELLDKPVSICSDDSGHLDDPGLFNRLISNEPIQIKVLWKNTFSTTLNTFFIRAYNDFITAPSGSQGLNRRIVAMSFNHRPDRPDTELGDKLNAELSGIFNWAWQISHTEMKRRILWAGEVEAVADASTDRFLANNPAFVFLQEQYANGGEIKIRDLYKEYSDWSKDSGRIPVNQRLFTTSIKEFGCYQQAKIDGIQKYVIPKMCEIDVTRFLGIKQKADFRPQELTSEITPESGENGEKGKNDKHIFPVNSLSQNQDPETDSQDLRELREKREKLFPVDPYKESISEESNNTLFPLADFSSTDTNPHAHDNEPTISSPTVPVKNDDFAPYEIAFRTAKEAKQWKEVIEIKYSEANGILTKYARKLETTPDVPKYHYYLYFRRLSPTAIEWLNQQNFNEPPPARRR